MQEESKIMDSDGGRSEKDHIVKAAGTVGSLTFLSRILGYVRDMAIASIFGAGVHTDAFIAAFRIPNLMRRLFGEGALSVAFVPVFSQYLIRDNSGDAYRLARASLRLLTLILFFLVLAGIWAAPLIIRGLAPGFIDDPDKMTLTITLTRIMFPYLFFIGLVALSMSILNTLGHFAAPALAPVFLNIAMLGALWTASIFFVSQDEKVMVLSCGVLLGGGLQLILQFPFLHRCGIAFRWRGPFFHPGLKKVGRLLLPTIFGSSVYQINILVGTFLASQLPQGSISYLYYADRLVQFPLGVFAVALGTAVLPALSRQAAVKDYSGLKQTFSEALNLIFFISIPSMVGLIILRQPIVSLLFERGAFDPKTSQLTADALLYYGAGLWAFSAVRVLLPTFYALQDTWMPVKISLVSISTNIVLGIMLMKTMGHCGLALATTLSSALNVTLLIFALRLRLGAMNWRENFLSVSKSIFCAFLMGGVVWWMAHLDWSLRQNSRLLLFGYIAIMIAVGVGIFLISAATVRMREVKTIWGILRKA